MTLKRRGLGAGVRITVREDPAHRSRGVLAVTALINRLLRVSTRWFCAGACASSSVGANTGAVQLPVPLPVPDTVGMSYILLAENVPRGVYKCQFPQVT
jgi:hypothetical protein